MGSFDGPLGWSDTLVNIDVPDPRDQIATRALPLYLDYRARLLAQLFADVGLVASEAA